MERIEFIPIPKKHIQNRENRLKLQGTEECEDVLEVCFFHKIKHTIITAIPSRGAIILP